MPNKFVIDNPSQINREKAKREYAKALENYSDSNIKNEGALLAEFFAALQRFFASLGKPSLTRRRLVSPGEPPTSKKYNATLTEIRDDIGTAYVQQNSLETAVIANFNLFQTQRLSLENALADTKFRAEDYSIFSKAVDSPEIWFKDSFNNKDYVDTEFGTLSAPAHIDTDSGTALLPKISEDRAWDSLDDFEGISFQHDLDDPVSKPYRLGSPSGRRTPLSVNTEDHYQGKMYGLVTLDGSPSGEDGIRIDESDVFSDIIPLLKAVDIEDVPDAPTTFWEYELVILEGERVPWSERQPDTTRNVGRRGAGQRRTIGTGSDNRTDQEQEGAVEAKTPGIEYAPGKTADGYVWNQEPKLDAKTDFSLGVSVTLTFKENKRVNSIAISPHTFGKKAYPVILDIATSSAVGPQSLEGEDHRIREGSTPGGSPNVPTNLTSLPQFQGGSTYRLDTNSVRRSSGSERSMTRPYRFDFPAREVKAIVITFKQDTSYPIEYTLGLASRNWTIKTTKDGGWFHRDKVKRTEQSKFVWIDFLGKDFMKTMADQIRVRIEEDRLRLPENVLLGETPATALETAGGVAVGAAVGAGIGAAAGSVIPIIGTAIGAVIGGVVGGIAGGVKDAWNAIFGGKIKTEIEKEWDLFPDDRFNGSGFYDVQSGISNRWRYAVGIQDIFAGSAIYANNGELISRRFTSPLPIHKIALEVDETIPPQFPIDDRTRWIEYYISIDDGRTFQRINPLQADDVKFPDDLTTLVPKIITVNSDIPVERRRAFPGGDRAFLDIDGPAYHVRFKATLKRPATIAGITDSSASQFFSPQLHSYGVRILPKEIGGTV